MALRPHLRPAPDSRPSARHRIAVLLVAALAACDRAGSADDAPPPPTPARLEELDPLLSDAIRAAVARVETVAGAPEAPAAWRALAELYLANGLYGEAESAYDVALPLAAGSAAEELAKLWYGRALNAVRDGRADDGLAFAERAAELAPGYAPLSWRIGEWRFAGGDLDGARAWYERASAAEPQHPGGPLGLARVHLQRAEYEPAAQILATRVLGGPSDGYGRMLLARAYQGLGRADEARLLAAQARDAQPQIADPWYVEILGREVTRHALLERANQLLRAGRPRDAIAILEPLLVAQPDDVTALSNLASALLSAGRVDEALAHARKAAELDPGGYRPLLIQALALARRGASGRDEAIGLLRRALVLQPSAEDVHNTLGSLLVGAGDREGALAAFRDGSRFAPDNLDLLLNVATLERQLGRLEQARADYERWLALAPVHPNRANAVVGLADVLLQSGDAGGAEAILGPAVDALDAARGPLDALTIDARTRLVAALEAQGKAEAAAAQRKRLP